MKNIYHAKKSNNGTRCCLERNQNIRWCHSLSYHGYEWFVSLRTNTFIYLLLFVFHARTLFKTGIPLKWNGWGEDYKRVVHVASLMLSYSQKMTSHLPRLLEDNEVRPFLLSSFFFIFLLCKTFSRTRHALRQRILDFEQRIRKF